MANLRNSQAEKSGDIKTDVVRERTACCSEKGWRVWMNVYLVTDPNGPRPTCGATAVGEFIGCGHCKRPVGTYRTKKGEAFLLDTETWKAMLARVETHGPSAYFCVKVDGHVVVYDWSRNAMVQRLKQAQNPVATVASKMRTEYHKNTTQAKNVAILETLPVALKQEKKNEINYPENDGQEPVDDDNGGVQGDVLEEPF